MDALPQKQETGLMLFLEMLLFVGSTLWSIVALSNNPYFFSDAFMKWLCELMGILQNWQTLISSLAAIGVAYLTFRFSIEKFRSEKWWSMKLEAYQRITEALNHSKIFTQTYLNKALDGRQSSDDQDKELNTLVKNARQEIYRAVDLGTFIIAKEALDRLRIYLQEISKNMSEAKKIAKNREAETDLIPYMKKDITMIKDCIKDLTRIAEKDLGKRI
tara:strand:- start:44 stop:694 length:651 start_codon:yes stop_codon:yes gene_type:complete